MLKLDHKAKLLLLVAVSALASASPVLALDETTPSKPLNLLSFARARQPGPQKPRNVTSFPSDNAAVRATAWAAEDGGPATTGAVPAALAHELTTRTRRHAAPPPGQRATIFHFEDLTPGPASTEGTRRFFVCGTRSFRKAPVAEVQCRLVSQEDMEPSAAETPAGGAGASWIF